MIAGRSGDDHAPIVTGRGCKPFLPGRSPVYAVHIKVVIRQPLAIQIAGHATESIQVHTVARGKPKDRVGDIWLGVQ